MISLPAELCAVEHRFPQFKELYIHPISDVHIEAKSHRDKAFQDKLKELKALPDNHRILLMGDLLDAAILGSKGFYHGAKTVDYALGVLEKLFEPLADRIDLIIPGNHEERVMRAAGVDISMRFAAAIGRPEVYRPLPSVVKYNFYGRKPSKHAPNLYESCRAQVFVHHGHGGGARPGSSVNRLEDLAKWKPDCDVYLMGHVHRKFTVADEIYMGWPIRAHKRLFICTGTYLGHEAYAQRFGLTPQRAEGSPIICIRRNPDRISTYPLVTAEI